MRKKDPILFSTIAIAVIMIAVMAGVGMSYAVSSYLTAFKSTYPNAAASTQLNTCGICHVNPSGGGTRNVYGTAFAAVSTHSSNPSGAFATIGSQASLCSGYTYVQLINLGINPGNGTCPSGGTTDTTAPTVTAFSIPATSTSLTVSITTLTASDNVGVTGFLVNESATKPLATAAGWSASAPTSYTFASTGAKTLYAWAKDAAGNVSASRSASVTVSGGSTTDTTAPTVTAFSIPSTSTSLTVSITTLSASDNVGVTGYTVNQSATKPLASAAGWTATPPASFTFTSTGAKVLYAWAKDAAGNVSASRSASVTISGSTPPPSGTTGISGVVKDIVTGAAISGATISDGSKSVTTSSTGAYTLRESAGNFTLTISKSGYLTTKQVATVVSGATKTVNWALTRSYGTQSIPAAGMSYVIFAWNDLGMHCDQNDYSYFGVLPPFNTLHVQVFRRGSEGASLINSGITVSYAFPKKTNSALHTNFWVYAPQFGWNVPTNVGITGTPLKGNMKLDATGKTYEAVGIPITPYDDDGTWDPYGTATITVKNSSGSTLQTATVVAPVSTEMMCSNCHGTANTQLDILQRHDAAMGTTFVADQAKGIVHLCGNCHQDNALGTAGVAGIPSLSLAMHDFHKDKMGMSSQPSLNGCYNCHPGPKTQCLRGIMARAGKTCVDCHGDMNQVSTSIVNGRQPWVQEPKCADCHDSAHAENSNTLYRNSLLMNAADSGMNNKIYCEACHNGTHAELVSANAADPTISKKFQGDSYWIWNCNVCHGGSSSSSGMHRGSGSTSGGGGGGGSDD